MRELMTHTAGFSYGFGSNPIDYLYRDHAGKSILECGSLQAMIDRLSKVPLLYQPGSRWVYSVSMDIQGYIIEKLSGMTLPEFMRKRLFEPLAMEGTGFYVPESKRQRFAALYSKNPAGKWDRSSDLFGMHYDHEPRLPSGGGGIVSTASDYCNFAQMLLNKGEYEGSRILSPASVKLMMSNHLPALMTAEDKGSVTNCPRLGMGYGYNGAVVVDPAEADVPLARGTYLWDGLGGTWFWVDPVNEIVFVAMNQQIGSSLDETGRLQDLSRAVVYQALSDFAASD
jgi:CubicO group peptidase (beta-lactamase class C family)